MGASAKEVGNLRKELANVKKAMLIVNDRLDKTMQILHGLIKHLGEKHVLNVDDSQGSLTVNIQPEAAGTNENSGGSTQPAVLQTSGD